MQCLTRTLATRELQCDRLSTSPTRALCREMRIGAVARVSRLENTGERGVVQKTIGLQWLEEVFYNGLAFHEMQSKFGPGMRLGLSNAPEESNNAFLKFAQRYEDGASVAIGVREGGGKSPGCEGRFSRRFQDGNPTPKAASIRHGKSFIRDTPQQLDAANACIGCLYPPDSLLHLCPPLHRR